MRGKDPQRFLPSRRALLSGGAFMLGATAGLSLFPRPALSLANRHGLATGATGTGKTVTLQVMAEGFARAGVPVFAADIKGDLSGIAEVGEAKDFIRDGHIGLNGSLPVNTNGGLLGEGYIHGMNNILEGVRQVRGTAANQIAGAEHVLVSASRSGMVLGPL